MNNIQLLDHRGQPMAYQDTAHHAASLTRQPMRGWNPSLNSADADLLDELPAIVARSNDMTRNNGVAAGYPQTLVDNVIGAELRLSSKPDYRALGQTKEWSDEWSQQVEALWRGYSQSKECSAANDMTLGGQAQLAFRTAIIGGEALALPLWLENRKYKTTLMLIDPSRLSNPNMQMNSVTLRNGIEINEYGEPLAYHIQKDTTPGVMGLNFKSFLWDKIPARTSWGRKRVIHAHDKERTGQTRGKPFIASVLGDFKRAGQFQNVTLDTAVANSLVAAFIETSMSGADLAEHFGDTYQPYDDSRRDWNVKMEGGGALIPLAPGDRVAPYLPNNQGADFGQFMEAAYRNIAAGLHIPYELLLKDFSKTSYSSARAAMLEAWRFFMGRRNWLANNFYQEIYELWLEEIVNDGLIDAPDFYHVQNGRIIGINKAYSKAKWIGPPRGWVDPAKEVVGAKLRMEYLLSTQEDECAEQGKDYEEVQDQRLSELQRALKMVKEAGLPEHVAYSIAGFTTIDPMIIQNAMNQPPAGQM
jgi:lambda family phage portal protein